MLERSVHKESAKPESKNSKETSENNTDIEMDLHIMFSNVFECYSNVLKCSFTGQTLDWCRTLESKFTKAQQLDQS